MGHRGISSWITLCIFVYLLFTILLMQHLSMQGSQPLTVAKAVGDYKDSSKVAKGDHNISWNLAKGDHNNSWKVAKGDHNDYWKVAIGDHTDSWEMAKSDHNDSWKVAKGDHNNSWKVAKGDHNDSWKVAKDDHNDSSNVAKGDRLCDHWKLPPDVQGEAFQFQEIRDRSGPPTFVYSAHVGTPNNAVRMVAITPVKKPPMLTCFLWFREGSGEFSRVTVKASVETISGGHDGKHEYKAVFLICPLSASTSTQVLHPQVVTLVFNASSCPSLRNSFVVRGGSVGPQAPTFTYNFTVCVKPFNYNYDDVLQLVEFIEFSRVLGAGFFVFYDFQTSPRVLALLQQYAQEGLVVVLPWKLPVRTRTWPPTPGSQLHAFGQLASSNDCLLRYRHQTRFSVFVDLDEYIVPLKPDQFTWHHMLAKFTDNVEPPSVFRFYNIFVRTDFTTTGDNATSFDEYRFPVSSCLSTENTKHALFMIPLVVKNTIREEKIVPSRSKFILDPRRTSMVDIHTVTKTTGKQVFVPSEYAMLFHYRDWESPHQKIPRVKDETIVAKYGHDLVVKLRCRWSLMCGGVCEGS